MSASAIAAITGRIASIQGRFDQLVQPGGGTVQRGAGTPSFSQLLSAATAGTGSGSASAAPATSPASHQTGIVLGSGDTGAAGRHWSAGQMIGMLGTPVKVSGHSATTLHHAFSQPGGDWWTGLPARGVPWAGAIEDAARRNNLDPRLLAALVWTESEFTPDAVSHSGAIGLTQLMPATADGLGVDPTDPLANLDGGARFLADMLRRFGSLELGLAAYNAGPGSVRRAGGIPSIPETQAYVPKVLGYYRSLGGLT